MYKLFNLQILTPEREFFNADAQAVILRTSDGEISIMADHAPIVMPVEVGNIKIRVDDQWRESFNSEGFMEVHRQGTLIFVQACEWPEEIDTRRAEEARRRAEEHLRQKQSISEYKQSKLALARAMARLRITKG